MAKEPFLVDAYTDGACSGNPGPAGCACVLSCGPMTQQYSKPLGHGTNNLAELKGIELALAKIKPEHRWRTIINIYTDSDYARKVILDLCKTRVHKELIRKIKKLIEYFKEVQIHHLNGHSGHVYNNMADKLAKQACKEKQKCKASA